MAKFSIGSTGLMLTIFTGQFKSASMIVYSGTQPSTPETAIAGGNVVLATFTFNTTPFSTYANSSGLNVTNGSFVSNTVTPSNNGTATFARINRTLVSSNAGAWTTGTAYTLYDTVTSNSAYWLCLKAGTSGATAPTGANVIGFNDGTCVWAYISATSAGLVIGDFTVGVTFGSFDVIVPSTTFSTSTNQTLTAFQFSTAGF